MTLSSSIKPIKRLNRGVSKGSITGADDDAGAFEVEMNDPGVRLGGSGGSGGIDIASSNGRLDGEGKL